MTDSTATIPATGPAAVIDAPRKDLIDTAKAAGTFATLEKAIGVAGMASTLQGPGPYTVFAPTDTAFSALPAGAVDTLLKDVAKLSRTLSYHVVPGRFTMADLKAKADVRGSLFLKTLTGTSIAVKVTDGAITMGADNKIKVTSADVLASNGVIHVIDTVLTPVT